MQLRHSRDEDEVRRVAELIIGNIDEKGYLMVSLEELQAVPGVQLLEARVSGVGLLDLPCGWR